MLRHPPRPPLFPYTTLFRSNRGPNRRNRELRVAGYSNRDHTWRSDEVRRRLMSREVDHRARVRMQGRSEEHTSELQSRLHLVCRLLLEKKKKRKKQIEKE